MMQTGQLRKLKVVVGEPLQYFLRLHHSEIHLNAYLGKPIRLVASGDIYCIQCGRKTRQSFQQGFCFPCFRHLQACHLCIIYPERCLIETGQCPADDWAHAQCGQRHVIYLANASHFKVGITRETNQPARWLDQGAIQAMPIFTANNRYQAGMMEMTLKSFISDRTNWRLMLKDTPLIDLLAARDQLFQKATSAIAERLQQSAGAVVAIAETIVYNFHYPVLIYPEKLCALSFDKTHEVSGILLGLKGQYLLLDTGVLNIRKFAGYQVTWHGL